jgi:hypothetical protein
LQIARRATGSTLPGRANFSRDSRETGHNGYQR